MEFVMCSCQVVEDHVHLSLLYPKGFQLDAIREGVESNLVVEGVKNLPNQASNRTYQSLNDWQVARASSK